MLGIVPFLEAPQLHVGIVCRFRGTSKTEELQHHQQGFGVCLLPNNLSSTFQHEGASVQNGDSFQRCALVGNSMMRVLDVESISQTVFRILRWFVLHWQVHSTVQLLCVMGGPMAHHGTLWTFGYSHWSFIWISWTCWWQVCPYNHHWWRENRHRSWDFACLMKANNRLFHRICLVKWSLQHP